MIQTTLTRSRLCESALLDLLFTQLLDLIYSLRHEAEVVFLGESVSLFQYRLFSHFVICFVVHLEFNLSAVLDKVTYARVLKRDRIGIREKNLHELAHL